MPTFQSNKPTPVYTELVNEAHAGLKTVLDTIGKDAVHPSVARCFTDIGKQFFDCQEFFYALQYFKRALGIYLMFYQSQSSYIPEVALVYNHVGNTYKELERYEIANQNFLNSLEILKAAYGENACHEDIAITNYQLADCLRKQAKLVTAYSYNIVAESMLKDIHGAGAKNKYLVRALYFTGLTLFDQCKYKQADSKFKQAINMLRYISAEQFLTEPAQVEVIDLALLYLASGDILAKMGCLGKAREMYVLANTSCKTFWGDDEETSNVFYAEIMEKVASLNLRRYATKFAHEDFENAYSLKLEFYNEEHHHAPVAQSLVNFGHVCKSRYEYDQAIQHYKDASEIFETVYSYEKTPHHPDVARCQNYIGEVERSRGKFSEALSQHQEALCKLQTFFGSDQNHPDIAKTYRHIAAVYSEMADYDKVHHYNYLSLKINKAINNDDINHESICENYIDYGKVYFNQGETRQAGEYYIKAFTILEALFPSSAENELVIDVHQQIGLLQLEKQSFQKAFDSQDRASCMAESLHHKTLHHPLVAHSYKLKADVYSAADMPEEAMKFYSKANHAYDVLHHKEDMMYAGNRHPGKAIVHVSMAIALAQEDKLDQAAQTLKDANTLLTMTFGLDDHPIRGTIYKLLGDAYHALGDDRTAYENYKASLQIREKVYGQTAIHPEISACCFQIGMVLGSLTHYHESLDYCLRAHKIRSKLYKGVNTFRLTETLDAIGVAYCNLDQYDRAQRYFHKALEMTKAIFSPNDDKSENVVQCYGRIANMYKTQKQYVQAVEAYNKALEICEKGNLMISMAKCFDLLGTVHAAQGQWDEAIEYHQRALDLKKQEYDRHLRDEIGEGQGKVAQSKVKELENHVMEIEYPVIALTHNYLANTYLADAASAHHGEPHSEARQEKYNKALEHYKEALSLLKFVYKAHNHPHIASVYSNLGLVLQSEAMQCQEEHKDDCDAALEYHTAALTMRKALYGSDTHANIAYSLLNIGKCYHIKKNYEDAITHYNKALNDYHVLFGDDIHQLPIAEVYSSLGTLYFEVDAGEKALDAFEQAHKILTSLHGALKPVKDTLVESYKNLGNVHRLLGNAQQSENFMKQAQEVEAGVVHDQREERGKGCRVM